MPASLTELRVIFCDALGCESGAERARFLDRACNRDDKLRARVENLLAVHAEAGELPSESEEAGLEESARMHSGVMVGPYRLIEKIGEGGFGIVFLAEQRQPVQRLVAVKVLRQGMDNRQGMARFEAECQALALMEHPNIVHVFDGGTTNGTAGELGSDRPYVVMELCRGIPITDYCKTHAVPLKDRLGLFISVCQAVQHAHQKGIIHRDLKPSNVLVTKHDEQPVVKIIDFGIAKVTERAPTESPLCTGVAQIIGTPLYMSPEQARTGSQDIDTRTDIYSLGVLLYELLTETTPFDADRLHRANYDELRRIIREEEPPRPSRRTSSVPHSSSLQELDWVVMKALEKERTRRYDTAGALAADVRHYLRNEPVQACPPSLWYRFGKLARRNQGVLVAAALVLLALVVGTVASSWQALRATAAMNAERQALLELGDEQLATRHELENTKLAEEKATRELFEALVAQARANRLSRRMGQRFGTLEILRKATGIARQLQLPQQRFLELRNEALAALALTDLRVVKEWTGPSGGGTGFDYKLERYARAEADGTICVRRLGDGEKICSLPGPGPQDSWPIFSPDGQFLAVKCPRLQRVIVWRLEARNASKDANAPAIVPVKVSGLDLKDRVDLAFSADSRLVGIEDPKGLLEIFDLASGSRIQSHKFAESAVFEFHPLGGQLAAVFGNLLQVVELQTGKVVWQQLIPGAWPFVAWQPDGKTLAVYQEVGGAEAIFSLWDTSTRQQIGRLEGMGGGGPSCAFDHSGTLLAGSSWEGTLRLWDPLTGRQLFSTLGMREGRFSPDGHYLVTTENDDKLRLVEVAPGIDYRTLTGNPLAGKKFFTDSSLSADGKWLAAGLNGGVGVWDLVTGKNLAFFEAPAAHFVSFEPGALLSMGREGLLRRPMHIDSGSVHFGPSEKLPVQGSSIEFAQSKNGKVLAAAQERVVLFVDQPGRSVQLGPHYDTRRVAVSPDGRLVATGGFGHPGDAKVWESRTGKLVKHLPVGSFCRVAFSPNGKRLLTGIGNGQIRVWDVSTWDEIHIPIPLKGMAFDFSADGKVLAVETGAGIARLIDPQTGREHARLEDPNQHRTDHFTFSSDRTKLICVSGTGHCLHIWNLGALRRQLRELDLDWQD
jgi:serine/threonine protein kinase/WD40 repeat protein